MIPQIAQLGLKMWLAGEVQPINQDTFFGITKTAFPKLRHIRHARHRRRQKEDR